MKIVPMVKKTAPKRTNIPRSKIPISFLIDYIKEGYSLSDFLSSYPWIKREDTIKALEEIKKREFTSEYVFK